MSKKYSKEIIAGTVPVLLLFALYIGASYWLPVLFIGIFGGSLFYLYRTKGRYGVQGGDRKLRNRTPSYLTFEDIGGQDRAKQELIEALDFLTKAEEIKQMGIRPLKGLLLAGPPGTGKTLLAKAAAHYSNAVFISASGSEFIEMYVGVGASRIRDLFRDARQQAHKEQKENAVIFIDEIDVIGGKREGGQQREYDQTLNQLLTEMDGIHSSDSPRILLIAATNRKEMLDSALLRPGRFDRHIEVALPDKKGRLHILKLHAANKPLHDHVSLDKVAQETFGFSGAQLESVMNEAAIYAMREQLSSIEQAHLAQAIDKVMMGEKTDRESTEEERRRVALHELGHAIVAEKVRPGSVSQVALSPRGQALGYVRHHPAQDHYLYTKPYLEQQIMISLGGAAAEEIFYEGRSTGSRNDFEQAMKLVRTMIDCGLTTLGIVNEDMLTKDELRKANHEILEELSSQTKVLLEAYRPVFIEALDKLIAEESLSGHEFRALLQKIDTNQVA